MITKKVKRRRDGKTNIRRLVQYVEAAKEEDEEKCLYSNYRNFQPGEGETQELRIKTMKATADAGNSQVEDPYWHGVMSWREGEIPTKEQVEEAVDIYLKEMGFKKCQCVYALHQNTHFMHVHIAVNRIEPETYKAIYPEYSFKKAQKISRTIELEQGWERVNSGKFYRIIDDQVVEIDSHGKPLIRAIKQDARDMECRQGEKSGIRIAQNNALPILWKATKGEIKTWEELHEELSEYGFEIKKAGRGGVLVLHQDGREIGMKLSSVSQSVSLSKIEKTLGAFQEKTTKTVNEQTAQPLIDNSKALKEYVEEKKKFNNLKKQIIQENKNLYTEKRTKAHELYEKHKAERQKLFGKKGQWKGRGRELNIKRSVLAAKQLSEKQELKQYYESKKRQLKKQLTELKGIKFPDYRQWQDEKDNPDAKWRFIYSQTFAAAISGENNEYNAPQTKLFLNEYTTLWNAKQLTFFKDNKVAFRDNGYRITVMLDNEQNIKDALLLAQQKWGGCTLNGTDDFKKKAVDIAIKNNIRVTNPELQEMIKMKQEEYAKAQQEAGRVARTANTKEKKHINQFNEYAELLGTNHFRITCNLPATPERKGKTFLLKGKDESIDMHPYEIQAQWDKIEKLNASGWNIYVTPIPENMNKELYILVDDLNKDTLAQMKTDGYKPAAVFESSPGNYQAIIIVEKNFIENDETAKKINKEAANKLMQELNELYGDKNIRAAIHPHRIPGMNNNKIKRITENGGVAPEIKFTEKNINKDAQTKNDARTQAEKENKKIGIGVHCPLAQLRLNQLIETAKTQAKAEEQRAAQAMRRAANIGKSGTIDPTTAFIIHAKDIIQHYGVTDYSRLDAEVVVRLKATGYSRADIKEAVENGSPAIRPAEKRNKQWKNYAEHTAKYSDSFACAQKIKKQEHRIGAWLALEGRTKKAEMER